MVQIIAEAGINHGGELDLALMLVEAAKGAGADIVKFQTYIADKLLHPDHPAYGQLQRLSLPFSNFKLIARHCEQCGIEFLSTPGDVDSLHFLVEECGVKRIKIGSDDLTNLPLVRSAFATTLPVILSTGMASMEDIRRVLIETRAFSLPQDITLLHCVSLYPCDESMVNLDAMLPMRDTFFPLSIGYSDHTSGTLAPIAAAIMGAEIVEKHIMLRGYDDQAIDRAVSVFPDVLRDMVKAIRGAEKMKGHGRKEPWPEELAAAAALRKGPDGRRPIPRSAA